MSHVVAVAGGTGGLGRTIVEAIIETGKFELLILGREANSELEKDLGARIVPVDYTSVDALAKTLEDNKVDTVISTLSGLVGPEPDFNLIAAAEKSSTTKRYVPNTWGTKSTKEVVAIFHPAKAKSQFLEVLAKTSLEYTAWYPGYFMDYWVAPRVKSYLKIFHPMVDPVNNVAALPGSGNTPVVFTHTSDTAKFVATSLSMPSWAPETYVIGDKISPKELLAIAEEVKGTKFQVTYDPLEDLKAGKVTELPSHPQLYPFFPKERLQGFLSVLGLIFEQGHFDLKPDRTINQDFPEIKAGTFRELFTKAWKAE